jgi:hypothetical protein
MTTATATKPRAYFASDIVSSKDVAGYVVDKLSDGTSIIRDVEIFKSGTFRDSWGDQHTWTPEHLTMMVNNFNLLKDGGIFPNVPARRDHSSSIDKVMGYIDSVKTDGVKLFADIHITEPRDVDKLARGTYRSRSLEVGMYIDNSEAAYWPVVFGIAWVDIPAVEGLHSKSISTSFFSMVTQEEQDMSGTAATGTAATGTTNSTLTIQVQGVPADVAPARVDHAAPVAGAPVAPAPAPAATFRINGAATQDVAAVQAHIETLETFAKATHENVRKDFVSGLVKAGKLLATGEAALATFAIGLTDDQFKAWSDSYASVPTMPLLAKHGAVAGSPDAGAPGDVDARTDRISILQETVTMLHRTMSKEKVEQTSAFKELAQLNTAKS